MRATILLFEDDPDICRLVMELLDERGHLVYPVGSREQAIEIVGSARVDLFLADSDAPIQELALESLRSWCELMGPEVPVIAFTAHKLERAEARELGCADVIPKPFDIDELLGRVEECLRAGSSAGVGSGPTRRT